MSTTRDAALVPDRNDPQLPTLSEQTGAASRLFFGYSRSKVMALPKTDLDVDEIEEHLRDLHDFPPHVSRERAVSLTIGPGIELTGFVATCGVNAFELAQSDGVVRLVRYRAVTSVALLPGCGR